MKIALGGAVLAALILLQDPSPVKGLLARIDGRDPAACFRAIADLADLNPRYQPEIEKGVGALPAFYREALLNELKTPAPPGKRVSLEGTQQTAEWLFERWSAASGLELKPLDKPEEDPDRPPKKYDLSMKESPPLEALARLCAMTGHMHRADPMTGRIETKSHWSGIWACGHRSAAIFNVNAALQKRVNFSGPPVWRASLDFTAVLGGKARIVGFGEARVLEAVSDGGEVLEKHNPGARPMAELFDSSSHEPELEWDPSFTVDLRAPEGVGKLGRLKLVIPARVVSRMTTVILRGKALSGEETISAEGHEVIAKPVEAPDEEGGCVQIQIRPAKGEASRLRQYRPAVDAGSPVSRLLSWIDEGAPKGDFVFRVRWWAKDGDSTPPVVRVHIPLEIEERLIYAEFKDIPLK